MKRRANKCTRATSGGIEARHLPSFFYFFIEKLKSFNYFKRKITKKERNVCKTTESTDPVFPFLLFWKSTPAPSLNRIRHLFAQKGIVFWIEGQVIRQARYWRDRSDQTNCNLNLKEERKCTHWEFAASIWIFEQAGHSTSWEEMSNPMGTLELFLGPHYIPLKKKL